MYIFNRASYALIMDKINKLEKENKMETKEQILNKIKELQAIVDKMPNVTEGLWKPKTDDRYWSIDYMYCHPTNDVYKDMDSDKYIISLGLYAKTKEEAEAKIEALQVHQQLKEIAHELNNGVEIDWNDSQYKYYLIFDYFNGEIEDITTKYTKYGSAIYCLSEKFKDVAIERIGKEKLERYLKEGF